MTRIATKPRCHRCGRVKAYCKCEPLSALEIAQIMDFYGAYIPRMRQAARGCGYALAEHGSMTRDCDLIAVPWTHDASDADTLIEALRASIDGFKQEAPDGGPLWVEKPHGRKGCMLYPQEDDTGRRYFDVSVMPRVVV